jgi:hypothetical protein
MKAILPKSILALSQLSASQSSGRMSMTNVLVKAHEGNFRAEATNGRLLGIINGYAEGECDILIDARKFAEIKKVMDRTADRIILETKDATFTAGGIPPAKFGADGREIVPEPLSKIGGEFHKRGDDGYRWPNTDQVIPSGKVACTFKIDAKFLVDVLRCAQAVNEGDCCSVTFTVFKDRTPGCPQPIAVSTMNEDGTQCFDAVIVPLVTSK